MKVWSSVLTLVVVALGVAACAMDPDPASTSEKTGRASQALCKGTSCDESQQTPLTFSTGEPPPPPPPSTTCKGAACYDDPGGGDTIEMPWQCPLKPDYQCGRFLWEDPELDQWICAESCCPKEDEPDESGALPKPGCGDSYYVPWNPCGPFRWYSCTPYGWCTCN
jgi:hypothetical protein